MSFLKINGIVVAVLTTGAAQNSKVFGSSDRTNNLTLVTHRRGFKKEWPLQVKHSDGLTMLAFEKLLKGEGQVWQFERGHPAGFYSSKGVPLVPSAASPQVAIQNPGYQDVSGYELFIADGQSAVAAGLLGDIWTVMFRAAETGWVHYVIRSDGAKWQAGVRNDSLDVSSYLDTSGGDFTLKAVGGDFAFDDVVVLPYLVPEDWPAQLAPDTVPAWGNATTLVASGNFIDAGTRDVEVKAEVDGAEPIPTADGEVWVLRGRLLEV